jgi:hypothetical protein
MIRRKANSDQRRAIVLAICIGVKPIYLAQW